MHFSNRKVALYIEATSSTFYASTWKRYSHVYTTKFGATTSTSWSIDVLYLVLSLPAIVLYIWLTCTLFVQFSILYTCTYIVLAFFSLTTYTLPLGICHLRHRDPFIDYFNSLYTYYQHVSSTFFVALALFLLYILMNWYITYVYCLFNFKMPHF